MTMKLRLGAGATALCLGVGTVIGSVTAGATAAAVPSPNVKLRVPNRAHGGDSGVWVARAPRQRMLRGLYGGFGAHSERSLGTDRLVSITVRVSGGPRRPIVTNADSVVELLRELGVGLRRRDIVRPGARSTLRQDSFVRVVRIRRKRERVSVVLPFDSVTKYSADIQRGDARIETYGLPGRAIKTYFVTYRNGKEVRRRLLSRRVLFSPVSQVVVRGTASPTEAPSSTGGVQYGEAVWYDTSGMVAAHLTLPFGTRVTVTNLDNGRSVTVVINDRGPYGGRIIDLSPEAFSQIAPLGQGVARVRITW